MVDIADDTATTPEDTAVTVDVLDNDKLKGGKGTDHLLGGAGDKLKQ